MKGKKAQVWVETVIYTLIGLTIMGIVLAIAKPKIEETKDKIVIEQTIEALNSLDGTIKHVMFTGEANRRINDFVIKRGQLTVDGAADSIKFEIDNSYFAYSEPGKLTQSRGINILTTQGTKKYKISLTLEYANVNITYNMQDITKTFSKASTPYKISIENKGIQGNKVNVDLSEVS